jgi:alkanesulfonate monooxygenase SsuD/methylene tetrahydromethanopterin reductase-like flavin-dependent oxidoreductase (luciferase family)
MDIGVCLPSTIPGTEGGTLIEWAKRAESLGFSSVGTVGRLVYPGYESLITLAAAAVTVRIRLITEVLAVPLYTSIALLAKQIASVDRLSGGRLVLGVGLGAQQDDFAASGLAMRGRGRRVEEQIGEMRRVWAGEASGDYGTIGPEPARPGGPPVLLGGATDATFRRVARLADGWIMSGGTPGMFAEQGKAVEAAWHEAGRTGRPRKIAGTHFGLGPDSRANADRYLLDFFKPAGPFAARVAESAAVDAASVKDYRDGFAANGCDELVFVPTSADLGQLDLLADALR